MHGLLSLWSPAWVLGLLLAHHAHADLVPVRLRPASSNVLPRDLQSQRDLLRPRHEVQMTYAERELLVFDIHAAVFTG